MGFLGEVLQECQSIQVVYLVFNFWHKWKNSLQRGKGSTWAAHHPGKHGVQPHTQPELKLIKSLMGPSNNSSMPITKYSIYARAFVKAQEMFHFDFQDLLAELRQLSHNPLGRPKWAFVSLWLCQLLLLKTLLFLSIQMIPIVVPYSEDRNQEITWKHLGSLVVRMQCLHCIGASCWVATGPLQTQFKISLTNFLLENINT